MSFRVNDRALKAGARCGRPHLHDNFCEELLRLAVVHGAGYSLRLEVKAHEDPDLSNYFEQIIGDKTLDGIIVVPQYRRDYPFLYPLQKHGFPYVMMRPACFGRDVNHLDLENFQGGQMVAQLFAQWGCSRVAMINGPETHVDAIERERGFFEGLLAAEIKKATKRVYLVFFSAR
jgi:DNA-binding LacI/PurR family transcriptional regulator